jgi:4a-hydroxytetrahydrobiopterin dehydratase
MTQEQLAQEHCQPRKGPDHALDGKHIDALLKDLTGWTLDASGKAISKDFRFKDFYQTIGFVNALAWIANAEDHHPDLDVGYGHCRVHWSTHDVGGLSLNDFICAAKAEALLPQ